MSKTEQELRLIVKCLPSSPFRDKADEVIERAIAESHRLRISQLRRMAHTARFSADWTRPMAERLRLFRFADRCFHEIERLRGEG